MNNSKQVFALAKIYQRHYSKTSEVVSPRFNQLKEVQKRFQVDDGTPIYLKAGFGDKMLFATTVLLTAIGVGMSVHTFIKIEFGKTT